MKFLSIFVLAIMGLTASADELVKLAGPFEIQATKGHKKHLKGSIQLYFDGDVFKKLEAKADDPVFGKKDFLSKDAYFVVTSEDQFALASLFVGAPHRFYLVWVGNLQSDNLTFAGEWFRVDQPLEKIKEALSNELIEAPPGWIKVGVGSFAPPTDL